MAVKVVVRSGGTRLLEMLCCRSAPARVSLATVGLDGVFALGAHGRRQQVLTRVQVVLAAHHRAGRLEDVVARPHTLPVLIHVVIACLVAEAAERAPILQLVRHDAHLAGVGLVPRRHARHPVVARLHADIAPEVDPLAAHFPAIAGISEHG